MALRFGQYKGVDLCEINEFDKQYIYWCIKNIKRFYECLDDTDKMFYEKLFYPFQYLEKKYSINERNLDLSTLIPILYDESMITYFSDYVSQGDGDAHYMMQTIFGDRYGDGGEDAFTNDYLLNILIECMKTPNRLLTEIKSITK